jgi:hypothetical protein
MTHPVYPNLNHPFLDETDCPHSSNYIEDTHSRYWGDDEETDHEYNDALYGAI